MEYDRGDSGARVVLVAGILVMGMDFVEVAAVAVHSSDL